MKFGFNDNVDHQGRRFHVQTEDSGVQHPHVITHLFDEGGLILKTLKTSYADRLDAPDLEGVVRAVMLRQHKAMCAALLRGRFNDLLMVPGPESMPRATRPVSGPGRMVLQDLITSSDLVQKATLDELLLRYIETGLSAA